MSASESIVCKPTPWFLLRATVMVAMFSIFAVLFFMDGSTGYRKKNESFYLYNTFKVAGDEFNRMNASGTLTPSSWKAYASRQDVMFPSDPSVLPAGFKLPMKWPAELQDFDRMKQQWNLLWREYSKQHGLDAQPHEEPYTASKINGQWWAFGFCASLAAISAFYLARTMTRSISADATGLKSQDGKRVPFSDLKKIDLRKWDSKGLAFIDYEGESGKGRIRIDGLTYGGFKKENGEPAEALMRHIRAHFSGEITEYAVAGISESNPDATGTQE